MSKYIEPFGAIFWCGFTLGFGVGGICITLMWWFKFGT